MNFIPEDIDVFRALFKGREDVFAVRWEKGNKSGYMPAYSYDPYHYRLHKTNGGSFQSYQHKTHRLLSDSEIARHLEGEQQIGIYPLLKDNTSWFLVADFDKADWQREALRFLEACTTRAIPAYLERSRSGNGGHVWIFFDKLYPAVRSRKLFITVLEESGAFSKFDKGSSFDRLFPNQDFLSGKGFGNLIALPLFKPAFEKGNSCFLDPATLAPVANQFGFLKTVKRIATSQLDDLLALLKTENASDTIIPMHSGKLTITLQNTVRLNRPAIPQPLVSFLKDELNFANSAFIVKKKSGKSTFETPRFFKLINETEHEIIVPRGFIGKLIRFCREMQITHDFIDNRVELAQVEFVFQASLRKHQRYVVESVSKKDIGVIVAPPGAGKTVMGLKIVADKKQPALIIVHRKQLLDQWVDRIEAFLGIPKKEVGIIGQGKMRLGAKVTVATIQSLPKYLENIWEKFGTIIVDECHRIPAESYRNTVESLNCRYCYGLTATPFRKYNDDEFIFAHLGEIIAEIRPEEIEEYKRAYVVIRNTDLDVPYNSKTDSFETLSQILIHDTSRNTLIVSDVAAELNRGKKAVIITERKEHIDSLHLLLKQYYETITLSGDDSDSGKKSKWKTLTAGDFQVLITTGQYFGEGSDIQHISTLFLAYPFSFHGKLIQYIGRVQRSEINPTIYDYRDHRIGYLDKLFLKRNTYYRKIDKQATLFSEPQSDYQPQTNRVFTLDKTIKVAIADLAFHYGHVAFSYEVAEMHTTLEFQVENLEMRPEFDVLKPYFVKALKSKHMAVHLFAEFEYGKLVAQSAASDEVERINKEIVEGVKFQFLNKGLLGKPPFQKQNILTSDQLQDGQNIYSNAQDLLNDILKQRTYKHSRQVQFLADRHESQLMKIRFVLSPFSFVFLLSGDKQYHIVLETLDTEEASYIWHTDKNKNSLIETVGKIDKDLQIIREKGRQAFVENAPKSFSRILHDYADPDKGFVGWKSLLEERLV